MSVINCACKVSVRHENGVSKDNPYLFALPYRNNVTLVSSQCLRQLAKRAHLKQPELVTCTRLRKHIATLSQVLNLTNNEMDILATFMGHDIRVHREYYRYVN